MSPVKPPKRPAGVGPSNPHRAGNPGESYPVGYGRPPQATRFKPGASGNPRGRAKGATSLATQLAKILNRKITVTEKGIARKMTLQEVMLTSVAANAAKGDLKSVGFLMRLQQLCEHDPSSQVIDPQILNDDDQALIAAFLKNNAADGSSKSPEPSSDPSQNDDRPSHTPTEPDLGDDS